MTRLYLRFDSVCGFFVTVAPACVDENTYIPHNNNVTFLKQQLHVKINSIVAVGEMPQGAQAACKSSTCPSVFGVINHT